MGARRHRRALLLAGVNGAVAGMVPVKTSAQAGQPRRRPAASAPVWTGFGLNGSAGQARFDLTRAHVERVSRGRSLTDAAAFDWLREPLAAQLRAQNPQRVQFRNSIEFGESLLVGFAHDYEAAVGARVEKDGENANTVFVFMSGVGMILGHDGNTWRVVTSFPFMFRFERIERDLSNVRAKAVTMMGEAYKGYAKSFVHFLGQFDHWERGFSNYFARVTRASIHPDAIAKLTQMRIHQTLTSEMLGFATSASISEHLDIPLLPFQENDALAKRYAVKFTDDLKAQAFADLPDTDLRIEIVLRDVDKKVIPNMQKGITIIRRQVVLNFRVFDAFDPPGSKPFLQAFAAADPGDDKIPFGSTEDDTPDRDFVFFDRQLTRTLSFLLKGIATKDPDLLAKAGVPHERIAAALPRFLELCAKTR